MNTILIADSGSTKADWLSAKADGMVLAEWNSPGINPFFQDRETISGLMEKEVFPRVSGSPAAIYFYGAGCADAQSASPVAKSLKDRFPTARVEVESDLLGAARSLCQHQPGIACILGTGSNNCLYDGSQIVGNIGSLGFWMGDEGSGGHLGRQLVVAYLHKELPGDLEEHFAAAYPGVNRMEILNRAYKQPFPNRYFAGYTRFAGAHRSHPFIQDLLRTSFGVFLDKYVLKHPGAQSYPVSFTGSVAWHFREELRAVLEEKGLTFGKIVQKPIGGLAVYHSKG
ncbi:MAG: N-acetylglucosamine kinase [Cytophagaceae bacterium SCN 52-12]|nr:MAG: N-acetylglucosamine kinase [Cytophagaceae bacterium SCN 52-12]